MSIKDTHRYRVAEIMKRCGGVSNDDLTLNATFVLEQEKIILTSTPPCL